MSAPPCDQLRYVVAADVGEELVLAEKVDQIADLPLGVTGTGVMLAYLLPVAPGNIIELQRRAAARACANGASPSPAQPALPLPLHAGP